MPPAVPQWGARGGGSRNREGGKFKVRPNPFACSHYCIPLLPPPFPVFSAHSFLTCVVVASTSASIPPFRLFLPPPLALFLSFTHLLDLNCCPFPLALSPWSLQLSSVLLPFPPFIPAIPSGTHYPPLHGRVWTPSSPSTTPSFSTASTASMASRLASPSARCSSPVRMTPAGPSASTLYPPLSATSWQPMSTKGSRSRLQVLRSASLAPPSPLVDTHAPPLLHPPKTLPVSSASMATLPTWSSSLCPSKDESAAPNPAQPPSVGHPRSQPRSVSFSALRHRPVALSLPILTVSSEPSPLALR